jgi:PPOX class probable F420-dependent enzyme
MQSPDCSSLERRPPYRGSVEIEAAVEFVRENHQAILSTRRADGRPQMSPVAIGPGPHGTVVISSREAAMKTRNIERRPEVSVCVFTDRFFGRWVQIDGNAAVIKLPEAMDHLEAYYRAVSGNHPDWDEYRRSMVEERRVIISITPERAGPDLSG